MSPKIAHWYSEVLFFIEFEFMQCGYVNLYPVSAIDILKTNCRAGASSILGL